MFCTTGCHRGASRIAINISNMCICNACAPCVVKMHAILLCALLTVTVLTCVQEPSQPSTHQPAYSSQQPAASSQQPAASNSNRKAPPQHTANTPPLLLTARHPGCNQEVWVAARDLLLPLPIALLYHNLLGTSVLLLAADIAHRTISQQVWTTSFL